MFDQQDAIGRDGPDLERRAWLARIRRAKDSEISGAGFAVDGCHVITAAHVVHDAGARPGDHVYVDFPLLGARGSSAEVLEDGWALPEANHGDHAVLELDDPPAGIQPVTIRAIRSLDGHAFTAYGFTRGYPDSIPATGHAGQAASIEWISLNVDNEVPIEEGFSGSAVWSRQCNAVVAMIVARDIPAAGRLAFAIPITKIAERISIVAQTVQPDPDSPIPTPSAPDIQSDAWDPTVGPDARLSRIRQAYDRFNRLAEESLGPEHRLRLQTIHYRLNEASIGLWRGDYERIMKVVETSENELSRIASEIHGPTEAAHPIALSPYGSASILVIKLIDIHDVSPQTYYDTMGKIVSALEDLQSVIARRADVSLSGAILTIVLPDSRSDRGLGVKALFALALRLHMTVAIGGGCRLGTIVSHGDDFARLEVQGPLSEAVVGQSIAEAAAIVEPLSTSVLIMTHAAFFWLRTTGGLHIGIRQDCTMLANIWQEFFPSADLLRPSTISELKFDCTVMSPHGNMSPPTSYAIHVYSTETKRPIIGLVPDLIEFSNGEHIIAIDDTPSDRQFVSELAMADEVEIVGITNYRLADILDRAWAIRASQGFDPWQQLRIYFPADSLLPSLVRSAELNTRSHRRKAGAKTLQMLLNSRGHQMAVVAKVAEFPFAVPFLGTAFRSDGQAYYNLALCFPGEEATDRSFFRIDGGSRLGLRAAGMFARLRQFSRELFDREVWLIRSEPSSAPRLNGLYSTPPANRELRLASALVILHAETAAQQSLLIQERTEFNSRDSAGTLSNITARVVESDLCALGAGSALAVSPREEPDEVVTTRVFSGLGLTSASPVPRQAFVMAAVRECLSGLGLSIDPDRLVWHSARDLAIGKKRIHFEIFNLELSRRPVDEVDLIRTLRPYANLHFISLQEVRELAKISPARLNTLLACHLDDTFMPIYNGLGLA
jgi:Trypsin-like peptidase domain